MLDRPYYIQSPARTLSFEPLRRLLGNEVRGAIPARPARPRLELETELELGGKFFDVPPPLVASWLLKCRRFCVCVDSNCSAIPNSGGV